MAGACFLLLQALMSAARSFPLPQLRPYRAHATRALPLPMPVIVVLLILVSLLVSVPAFPLSGDTAASGTTGQTAIR